MTDDLRSQVARRLADIFAEQHSWDYEGTIRAVGADVLLKQADEVIRIAEWARHCAFKGEHWVDDPDEPGHRMLRDASELPPTLPPEGWTP